MESLKEIAEKLKSNNNFILMGHVDPDGDCIGSLFALKWYLDLLGKDSLILLENPPAERYDIFGSKDGDYELFKNFIPSNGVEYISIALDSGDEDRLGSGKELAEKFFTINIDHHIDNPLYGDMNYINSSRAAVGEIIYHLIELDEELSFSRKIGTAISTAIIADTGGLRYQNSTADVFRIISEMVELGVDIYSINRAIFACYDYSAVKLKGLALASLKLHKNHKIAYLRVEQKMLHKTGSDIDEASGLVNYARDIKGVEVGLVFTEIAEKETRISFRSNHYCAVNEIAAVFGGGGHPRAAGCTIHEYIDDAEKMVLNKVEEYV